LDTVTCAVNQFQKKPPDFAATTRYSPLHFNSRISTQHILNSFVENIGVSVFSDALRLVSDALKSVSDALSVISDALKSVSDVLTFADDDLT
jgi:hypothetical protein